MGIVLSGFSQNNTIFYNLMQNNANGLYSEEISMYTEQGYAFREWYDFYGGVRFDREINEILDSFNLLDLRSQKDNLKEQIQTDLTKKIIQKHPLLVLINPDSLSSTWLRVSQ